MEMIAFPLNFDKILVFLALFLKLRDKLLLPSFNFFLHKLLSTVIVFETYTVRMAFLQQIVLLFHLIVQMVSRMHFVPAHPYVVFGKADSSTINLSTIAASNSLGGFVINGEETNDTSAITLRSMAVLLALPNTT
jgi:hypothetical protein